MVYAGTSWEGTKWKVRDVFQVVRGRRFDPRVILMLLTITVPVAMASIMMVAAQPADAHYGNACKVSALRPSGGPPRGGANMLCTHSGDSHYFYSRIWKDINNRPDVHVTGKATRTTQAYKELRMARYAGAGYYYSDGGVRYHDYDQSIRRYYY